MITYNEYIVLLNRQHHQEQYFIPKIEHIHLLTLGYIECFCFTETSFWVKITADGTRALDEYIKIHRQVE